LSGKARAQVIDVGVVENDFATDVRTGLTSQPKTLEPKYFYDDLGSILFEAICRLPEYYVARAEEEILAKYADDILGAIRHPVRFVELGSGSAHKTRHLIRAATAWQPTLQYVAIDIEAGALATMAEAVVGEFESLTVVGFAGTFEKGIAALHSLPRPDPDAATMAIFLGSTIGNLDPRPRVELLRLLRAALSPADTLLLGADSVKSESLLVPAYDDALGVTAAFNRNLLVRINRELGGAFDLATFEHLARYNAEHQRIEMHLVSTVKQRVSVADVETEVSFAEGETIHTESSYKFTQGAIERLARESGFELTKVWTDTHELFGSYLMTAV